jgi:hypothetical protein
MRNDARPIGEHAAESPLGGDDQPIPAERPDSRDSHKHGRQSHVVNRDADGRQAAEDDDPALPSSDASLNSKI